jgi:NTE family protein
VDKHARRRTVFIPTGNVTTTQFDLNAEDRDLLFRSGKDTAQRFLAGWDYEKYVKEFRIPHEHK